MRWLLLKDLRILRRSPLLVALLVLYPIVIAVLIGFAISRGPDKPTVAIYNGLPDSAGLVELGGERIDLAKEGRRIFEAVEPLRVDSRAEAIQKVRDGEALARSDHSRGPVAEPAVHAQPGDGGGLLQRGGPGQEGVRREHDQLPGPGRERRSHQARGRRRRSSCST